MFMHTGVGQHLAQAVSRIRRVRHRPTTRQQALVEEYLEDIQDRAASYGADDDRGDQLAVQAGGTA